MFDDDDDNDDCLFFGCCCLLLSWDVDALRVVMIVSRLIVNVLLLH